MLIEVLNISLCVREWRKKLKRINNVDTRWLVAPITSKVRGHGFEVPMSVKKLLGAILCQQVKMIDYTARGITFAEKASKVVVSDALAKVRVIVSES